jgi:serine/threonine protein phosphatase PrpC
LCRFSNVSWAIPRFDFLLGFAGASHAGKVRSNNEDAWRIEPSVPVFLVADGMGGHAAGEVASSIAVQKIVQVLGSADAQAALDLYVNGATLEARNTVWEWIRGAIGKAHASVVRAAEADSKRHGMGCTLDLAVLLGNHAFVAHVGDGRAYLARRSTTIQLTHDHTIAGALVAKGVGTPTQPPVASGALTNAIGRKGEVTPEEIFVELDEGDRLMICSDGVHGELGEEAKISALCRSGTPEDAAVALVNTAVELGGKDNATAVVIAINQRRIARSAFDGGLAARDASYARYCPLFSGLSEPQLQRALSASVQVQFKETEDLPRFFADDRVAYILLEGTAVSPNGWTLGPSSLVYPESLAGGGKGKDFCKAQSHVRALRIRADDFREVCTTDVALAAMLYERLARNMARAFG